MSRPVMKSVDVESLTLNHPYLSLNNQRKYSTSHRGHKLPPGLFFMYIDLNDDQNIVARLGRNPGSTMAVSRILSPTTSWLLQCLQRKADCSTRKGSTGQLIRKLQLYFFEGSEPGNTEKRGLRGECCTKSYITTIRKSA